MGDRGTSYTSFENSVCICAYHSTAEVQGALTLTISSLPDRTEARPERPCTPPFQPRGFSVRRRPLADFATTGEQQSLLVKSVERTDLSLPPQDLPEAPNFLSSLPLLANIDFFQLLQGL